jgi:hypothetical protein
MRSFKTYGAVILAMIIATSTMPPASAQDGQQSTPQSGATFPGSVFAPPPSDDLTDGEPEILSDLDFFLSSGYQAPDFNVYYNLRHDVGKEVLVPDYVKRTGNIPPEDVRVEVASAYLTGGDFNDIIVYSFLPGDCDTGCLAQVYRTPDGVRWEKMLEFKSLAFAYKPAEGKNPTEVVAVGGTHMNNRIYTWNGQAFVEK